MNSQDYHAHISRVSRTPSVLSDVPQYPNAHVAFNNNNNRRRFNNPVLPEERERVEVIEETKVIDNYGDVVYREQEVDVETDEFNTRRNNGGGFNLCKWKTFRP